MNFPKRKKGCGKVIRKRGIYSELSQEIAKEMKVLLNPHNKKFSRNLHQNLSSW